MRVALTVADFLNRAALVYGHRTAVVDEPSVPGSYGTLTYRELEARARGMALALDELGVEHGERVAIVSPNSGRFLTSYFGVSGYGRTLVPINFRLTSDEIAYVVQHSGASVLLYDPDLADEVGSIKVAHRFCLDGVDDAVLFAPAGNGAAPRVWEAREDASCSVNYTSGTTARPKGVQLTQRNCWLNAATFGWHTGVSDRDVLLHTLPMFHCNGWGMPYAVTGMGGTHIVLRKVGGEDILSRVEQYGVTLLCGAPAVVAAILERGGDPGRRGPVRARARHGADRRGRCAAAVEDDRAGGVRARVGVHSDLRPDRDRAAADHQPGAGRMGRPRRGGRGRSSSAGPAPRHWASRSPSTRTARCWLVPITSSPVTGSSPSRRTRRCRGAGSTRVTVATSTARTLSFRTARRT